MAISPLMNRFRSSRPEVFCKKGVLRDITKLTGRHLRQSLFFSKVAGQSFLRIWSQITEEIVNGKLHFLCSAVMFVFSTFKLTSVQVSQPRFWFGTSLAQILIFMVFKGALSGSRKLYKNGEKCFLFHLVLKIF